MRHLVRYISRVLTLFLASRQAWPKILGGGVSMFGGNFPPPKKKDAWIKHCLLGKPRALLQLPGFRLNWKLKVSSTADNADITQSQAT